MPHGKCSLTIAILIGLSVELRGTIALAGAQHRAHEGMTQQLDDFAVVFNRLNQPGRVVVFHAREIFSSYPGTMIEPAHILLGALRQDAALLRPYLRSDWATERIESALTRQLASAGTGPLTPEGIEVPFSPAVRTLLITAALIADELRSKTIDPLHLLVALLKDEGSSVAQLLRDGGVSSEAILAKVRPLRR